MEYQLTIYLIVFLTGIILGGGAVMSAMRRRGPYGYEEAPPSLHPHYYGGYPRSDGRSTLILIALLLIAGLIIALAR